MTSYDTLSGDTPKAHVAYQNFLSLWKDADHPTRPFREVANGYTPFAENDVIVAKITPCMEREVRHWSTSPYRRRLGPTEFHVLRATERVIPEWLFYFWRFPPTRKLAAVNMTESAGLKRVPPSFLANADIPLPEITEQKPIAGRLKQADRLRRTRRFALELTDFPPGRVPRTLR